jgi:hypothetical protein
LEPRKDAALEVVRVGREIDVAQRRHAEANDRVWCKASGPVCLEDIRGKLWQRLAPFPRGLGACH